MKKVTKIYKVYYDRETIPSWVLHCTEAKETEQFYFIPKEEQKFWGWSSRIRKGWASLTPEDAIRSNLKYLQDQVDTLMTKLNSANALLSTFKRDMQI